MAQTQMQLIDPSKNVLGWIDSGGGFRSAAGYWCTEYIPVNPGETLPFTLNNPTQATVWYDDTFFDANKGFLGGYEDHYSQAASISATFTVPANAAFMRVSYTVNMEVSLIRSVNLLTSGSITLSAVVDAWGTGRIVDAPIEFVLWSDANHGGNGDGTFGTAAQSISYLTYRISPTAKLVDFERHALSGSSYVKDDEGSVVMGSLSIGLAEGRTVSDITTAQVVVTDDTGASQTLTLSTAILTAALSENGYVESEPGLFASITFNTAYNYTLTFTIGDSYDRIVFSVLVARSFANLHLSGQPTGGIAIGKFSAATYGNPLFECAFPIVLSGSKTYGPSSDMPANPVEGQLYFVVE